MKSFPTPSITVNVDVTNPGQFFACCGLLELADRLWPGAEGWFDHRTFCIRRTNTPKGNDEADLFSAIVNCRISSSLTDSQIDRLKVLKNIKKERRTNEMLHELTYLNELWTAERIYFDHPFRLWIDWWNDKFTGGSSLKTWAGKQFIYDLVCNLQESARTHFTQKPTAQSVFSSTANDGRLPLYFDSSIGGNSSSSDVGFSLDAIDMGCQIMPAVELLAFVGLQRFRPQTIIDKELYLFTPWDSPLPVLLAAVATSGALSVSLARRLRFRLLYRTQYLKSFLPAVPINKMGE